MTFKMYHPYKPFKCGEDCTHYQAIFILVGTLVIIFLFVNVTSTLFIQNHSESFSQKIQFPKSMFFCSLLILLIVPFFLTFTDQQESGHFWVAQKTWQYTAYQAFFTLSIYKSAGCTRTWQFPMPSKHPPLDIIHLFLSQLKSTN